MDSCAGKRPFGVIALAACLAAAGGCGRERAERALVPPDFAESEQIPPLPLDAQADVHDRVRIGFGFVRRETMADPSGRERSGLTAGLWLYARGKPAQTRVAKVHAGQRFDVAGFRFFVEAIREGKHPSISLRALPPKAAASGGAGPRPG